MIEQKTINSWVDVIENPMYITHKFSRLTKLDNFTKLETDGNIFNTTSRNYVKATSKNTVNKFTFSLGVDKDSSRYPLFVKEFEDLKSKIKQECIARKFDKSILELVSFHLKIGTENWKQPITKGVNCLVHDGDHYQTNPDKKNYNTNILMFETTLKPYKRENNTGNIVERCTFKVFDKASGGSREVSRLQFASIFNRGTIVQLDGYYSLRFNSNLPIPEIKQQITQLGDSADKMLPFSLVLKPKLEFVVNTLTYVGNDTVITPISGSDSVVTIGASDDDIDFDTTLSMSHPIEAQSNTENSAVIEETNLEDFLGATEPTTDGNVTATEEKKVVAPPELSL